MSVDRPHHFVVAWAFVPRTAELAERVVRTTRARTADMAGIPWISDGWEPHAEAITEISRDACDAIPSAIGD